MSSTPRTTQPRSSARSTPRSPRSSTNQFTKEQRAAVAKASGRKGFKAHEFKPRSRCRRGSKVPAPPGVCHQRTGIRERRRQRRALGDGLRHQRSLRSSPSHRVSKRPELGSFAPSAGSCPARRGPAAFRRRTHHPAVQDRPSARRGFPQRHEDGLAPAYHHQSRGQ